MEPDKTFPSPTSYNKSQIGKQTSLKQHDRRKVCCPQKSLAITNLDDIYL